MRLPVELLDRITRDLAPYVRGYVAASCPGVRLTDADIVGMVVLEGVAFLTREGRTPHTQRISAAVASYFALFAPK
jgi:hypothetical protein